MKSLVQELIDAVRRWLAGPERDRPQRTTWNRSPRTFAGEEIEA